jgi:signal transduction histidine kinase
MKGSSALLRRQITLITLLVATVAAVLICTNLAQLTRSLVGSVREQAERSSLQAATAAEAALVAAPLDPPQKAISESQISHQIAQVVVKRGMPITSLLIEDKAGTPLLQVPENTAQSSHPLPSLESLAGASVFSRLRQILWRDKTEYEYSRALVYRGQEFGRVRLTISLDAVRREVWQSLLTDLLLALAAIAVATFIAISSVRLITAPLRFITSSIAQLEEGQAGISPVPNKEKVRSSDIESVADRIEQLSRQIAGDRSQLREARGGLQQILQNLQERLLLVSRDGRVMLASPGVDALLGSEQPMEGRTLSEIVGAEHPLIKLTGNALASNETAQRITLPATNGNSPVVASVQPIKDRGEVVGTLVSLHDRETVARLESQLDYSERLIDFARITSGIAHEVKNPLNAMVIHLELLRSKLQRISPAADDARPQLDILTSEIQRLDRVVQTFLDFTRPPRIHLRPLDVNQVLEETIALAAPEAEARGQTVWRSFEPDLPKIAGDADLLKQAFLNIVINGFQAMEQGGRLLVATTLDGADDVIVSITDHGTGIEPEARGRIFHLYYTTKPDGNGIGLAQAFRAVQLHNGQINFKSRPGHGTTFTIRLKAVTGDR